MHAAQLKQVFNQQDTNHQRWNDWVDLRPLETLAGGDQQKVLKLIDLYLYQFPSCLSRLENAIESYNREDVLATVEQMKLLVIIVRVKKMFDILNNIESSGAFDTQFIESQHRELANAHNRIVKDLYGAKDRLTSELN